MKKEHLFVAVKTCKKFHGERGAFPPTLIIKTLFNVKIALEGLLPYCFLVSGSFSFVIPVFL